MSRDCGVRESGRDGSRFYDRVKKWAMIEACVVDRASAVKTVGGNPVRFPINSNRDEEIFPGGRAETICQSISRSANVRVPFIDQNPGDATAQNFPTQRS